MDNITYTFIWWLWLFILGIISIPLAVTLFRNFFDRGIGLSKTLTLIFSSYVIFFFSTLKIIPFEQIFVIAVIAGYLLLNLVIYTKNQKEIKSAVSEKLLLILFEELLFAAGLILWAFVRAHQPDINGLEKLMDYGFVNSALKTRFLPPTDMWAAGLTINYYWYGHYVTAFLIKLSGIPSGFGYNLMLGTILGLCLTSAFSIVSSLLANKFNFKSAKAVIVGGIVSAVLLNFAGNFHTPFFVLKDGLNKYWYPDATRFIGYNPDVPDKTIHEFPIYSYVVADLHAHLLNIPLVLLYLSLLYVFISSEIAHTEPVGRIPKKGKSKINLFQNIKDMLKNFYSTSKVKILLGFLLGLMFMTNAWDFANYLLVSGFVLLFGLSKSFKKFLFPDNLVETAFNIIIIIITAGFTVLPFITHFESIAQGAALTHTKTPLWQLAILWGFPAVLSIIFTAGIGLFKKIGREDRFILAILVASWTLIALPEFVYVKDIYAATHYRANTMFKLTYQAYVMFYLSSGYIVINFIKYLSGIFKKIIFIVLTSMIFASILYYPFLATKSYYGKLFAEDNPVKSLSGDGWLMNKYPDTFAVVSWLKQNVHGQKIILEAPGDSYTDYDVISSYTGLQTVSGWYVHEWLWRGSPDFPQSRVNDITEIYNTDNPELAKSLLAKYKVNYVIVGSFETEKFPALNQGKFSKIGKVVYSNQTARIYKLN